MIQKAKIEKIDSKIKCGKQDTQKRVVDLKLTIPTITFKVNVLKISIKKQTVYKQEPKYKFSSRQPL